jgi:hypothetical protein
MCGSDAGFLAVGNCRGHSRQRASKLLHLMDHIPKPIWFVDQHRCWDDSPNPVHRTMHVRGDNHNWHVCVNVPHVPREIDAIQLSGHLYIRQKNIDPLIVAQKPHCLVGVPCFHDIKAGVAEHFRQESAD